MNFACVNNNLLDMRAKPSQQAERVNQALFGEPLRVGAQRSGFGRVEQTDGYSGWVDIRHLTPISQKAYLSFARKKPGRLIADCPLGSDRRLSATAPYKLFYGTPLWIESSNISISCLKLPDSRRLYVRSSAVKRRSELAKRPPSGTQIIREARKFLGIPYLWGGVTPLGWDCSAMVRAVMGRFGIDLPRDTKDQIKFGKPLSEDSIRSGDLLFFDRHVGFAIGSDHLIHASLGGGGVRINSLVPGDEDYRKDLHQSFKLARRII